MQRDQGAVSVHLISNYMNICMISPCAPFHNPLSTCHVFNNDPVFLFQGDIGYPAPPGLPGTVGLTVCNCCPSL